MSSNLATATNEEQLNIEVNMDAAGSSNSGLPQQERQDDTSGNIPMEIDVVNVSPQASNNYGTGQRMVNANPRFSSGKMAQILDFATGRLKLPVVNTTTVSMNPAEMSPTITQGRPIMDEANAQKNQLLPIVQQESSSDSTQPICIRIDENIASKLTGAQAFMIQGQLDSTMLQGITDGGNASGFLIIPIQEPGSSSPRPTGKENVTSKMQDLLKIIERETNKIREIPIAQNTVNVNTSVNAENLTRNPFENRINNANGNQSGSIVQNEQPTIQPISSTSNFLARFAHQLNLISSSASLSSSPTITHLPDRVDETRAINENTSTTRVTPPPTIPPLTLRRTVNQHEYTIVSPGPSQHQPMPSTSAQALALASADSVKIFACMLCPKKFKNFVDLIVHHAEHTGYDLFCLECEQTFISKTSKSGHVRIHHQDRQYICNECNISFTTKALRVNHYDSNEHKLKLLELARIKAEEKAKAAEERQNTLCTVCRRTYSTPSYTRYHTSRHFVDRNFRCEDCKVTFHRELDLTHHSHSPNTGLFECAVCKECFSTANTLKTHMKFRNHSGNHPLALTGTGSGNTRQTRSGI